MSLPVGVASGTVRLPLGNRTVSDVEVRESGEVVWDGTKYVAGVDGVRSATSGSTPAGGTVDVVVGSGNYVFTLTRKTTRHE
jgi:hypothetical protein